MGKQEVTTENRGAFNLAEAAAFMGTNHVTMRSLVMSPQFPAFRLGRRWVIPKDALIHWMNERAEERAQL